ncbi:mitochondrial substrate carrier family protein B-like protein [Tanacetum coccineum]
MNERSTSIAEVILLLQTWFADEELLGIEDVSAGGGLAGITAASVTYPLDLVRTRLSAQRNVIYYKGIWHALRTISREEGFFGLYKGLGACLLGVGPNLAISFSVYDTARSYWQLQRIGDPLFYVSKPRSACSKVFTRDIYGDHDLSCDGVIGIKHRHNVVRDTLVDICLRSAIEYGFLPFSFSSLGELEANAVSLLKRIRKDSMAQDIGARADIHIFNRISFAIAKGVGAQIVFRLPSNLL